MNAPAHVMFGATAYISTEPVAQWLGYDNFHLSAEHLATAMFFALWADSDLKQSWMGQSTGILGRITRWISGGHRKITHQWIVPLVIAVFGYRYYGYTFASAIAIGGYSHRVLDLYPRPSQLLQKIFIEVMSIIFLFMAIYRLVH